MEFVFAANHFVIHFKDEYMLIFIVWFCCIVSEYISAEMRLLASVLDLEMIGRDISERQKIGQKSSEKKIVMNEHDHSLPATEIILYFSNFL